MASDDLLCEACGWYIGRDYMQFHSFDEKRTFTFCSSCFGDMRQLCAETKSCINHIKYPALQQPYNSFWSCERFLAHKYERCDCYKQ